MRRVKSTAHVEMCCRYRSTGGCFDTGEQGSNVRYVLASRHLELIIVAAVAGFGGLV